MEPRRRGRILPFLGLALLLHYLVAMNAPQIAFWKTAAEAPELPVELSIDETPAPPAEQKKEEEQKLREERTPEGQVVDLPKPVVERTPDKARFVSEYDAKVEHETRSRRRGGDETRPTPRSAAGQKLAMRDRAQPGVPLPEAPDGTEGPRPGSPAPGSPNGLPTLKDLRPTEEQLRRAIGSRQMDYLDQVDDGDDTALNSKRWRFASFFNRVKQQVADNWHPEVAYRRRDPYGNIYGYRDRMTILRVHLDPSGNLEQLLLEHPSGVDFLDDEAMQAFRAAQPFPNPPRQLVDQESGLISFRFGFIFEVSSRPTFKVYRYSD
jgi:TonB family protein